MQGIVSHSGHISAPQSSTSSRLDMCFYLTSSNFEKSRANRLSITKRLLDYTIAVPLFFLLLPLMAIIAIAVRLSSRGPIFFVQSREGLGGEPIRVAKFRTMYIDADRRLAQYLRDNPQAEKHWRRYYKISPDPRVVRGIGSFLRKTSLDELPQLFSVIKSDMSLVGPRPWPYSDLKYLGRHYRYMRNSVWPGLTGLWQTRRGNNRAKEKYDLFYVSHWSLLLDLKILWETIPVVLFAKKTHW